MQHVAPPSGTRRGEAGRGTALALAAASLWGVSGAVAAGAFASVSPARVAQGRFAVAVLLLVPFALWKGEKNWADSRLLVFGLNMALVTGAFYLALERLGVGPGATIQFLGPLLVLFWMKYRQHRQVSGIVWFAAALALLGTALLTRIWDWSSLDAVGLGAGLASAVLFASYLLGAEALTARLGPITTVTGGVVVAGGFWLLAVPFWLQTYELSMGVWGALVWVGIAGTALPFLLEVAALRHVSSGFVGVIATAEPVIAAAAAWLLLDQVLRPVQILGGLLVLGAVASVQRWGIPERDLPVVLAP